MTRLLVGVAAAFILMAGPAAAEGLPPTSRIRGPEPVGPTWSGFYVGAGIGAGAASFDISGTKTGTRPGKCKKWSWFGSICDYVCTEYKQEGYTESFGDSGTTDVGVFGVVTVGYDRVLRQGWVGGVFADYDFGSGISGDVSVGGVHTSLDHDHSWAIGARLGYLVTPSTLLYGTAGYTQAEFELDGFGSRTFGGYFVGAGVETFLRQNWTLRLEYRFSQFGEDSIVDKANMSADLDPSMHSARLVLTYRLGRQD
jgi:opacity protein-like surface antigen